MAVFQMLVPISGIGLLPVSNVLPYTVFSVITITTDTESWNIVVFSNIQNTGTENTAILLCLLMGLI